MGRKFLIKIFLLMIVVGLLFAIVKIEPAQAVSTVGSSTYSNAVYVSFQKKTFYCPANSRWYDWYYSGSNFGWKTSLDNTTWSDFAIYISGHESSKFDIWYDETNNKICLVRAYSEISGLYYRQGTPNSDGSIAWDSAEVTVNSDAEPRQPKLCKDSDGYPWISYACITNDSERVVKATATNGSSWGTPTELWDHRADPYQERIIIVPLTNTRMLAISSATDQDMESRLYNGSSWLTAVSTTFYPDHIYHFDAVADGDNVHLDFCEATTLNIVYAKYTYGTGWGDAEIVETSTVSQHHPSITLKSTDKVRLFYFRSAVEIFYRDRDLGSWQTAIPISQSESTVTCLSSSYKAFSTNFSVTWKSGASSPFDVKFEGFTTTPSEHLCRFRSDPELNVLFSAGGSWHYTPYDINLTEGSQTFSINSGHLIKYVNDSWIYGFEYWSITNSSGTFNYTGQSVNYNLQEESNITMLYSYISINVSASPSIVPATFKHEWLGSSFTVPWTVHMNKGTHTFTCTMFEYYPNSSYRYTFDHWTVNGTGSYGSMELSLNFTADTNLTMVYVGSTVPSPYPYVYAKNALNATWYMRSDTHTIHGQLGWKLLTVNTATPTFDERISSTTQNVTYGVRVWAIDLHGNNYELTSGSPVAMVTKSTEGGEMMVGYWTCPAYSSMIDSMMVKVYQRFDEDPWSLRRIFITQADLLIRLPSSTWTFHYYVIRTLGSTNSTFGYGSYTTYNSRIDLQYYKASPWDVALARLWQQNFMAFLFTPWTYWFGDLFWTILLFGCIVMGYLSYGSFKPVLAILWILGGSGSILWALIPATALHVAVLMLAVAMTISFFRLIYR